MCCYKVDPIEWCMEARLTLPTLFQTCVKEFEIANWTGVRMIEMPSRLLLRTYIVFIYTGRPPQKNDDTMLSNFSFINFGQKSFPWTLFVIWWIIYHGATGERSNPIKSKYDKVMQTNPLEWVIIVTLVLNKVHYHIQCPTGTQTRLATQYFCRYPTRPNSVLKIIA